MEEKRFTLRMDGELFEEISEYAAKHRRSTAKEIELAIAIYLHDLKSKEIKKKYRGDFEAGKISGDIVMEQLYIIDEKYGIDKR